MEWELIRELKKVTRKEANGMFGILLFCSAPTEEHGVSSLFETKKASSWHLLEEHH